MAFPIEYEYLYHYDVYPKVVRKDVETEITIRPLGGRTCFFPGTDYEMTVKGITGGMPAYFPVSSQYQSVTVCPDADGVIRFRHTFCIEQEYMLDIAYTDHRGRSTKERFYIYCVDGDLIGRYPYIGDLHTHTTYSDGNQNPEVVCANYRKAGYDFLAITDHRRYYPSLEAMRFYEKLPVGLRVLPGEEVHLPKAFGQFIDPHTIAIGGEYSVNALIERDDVDNIPTDDASRSLHGQCPPVMDRAAYEKTIQETMDSMEIPEGVDRVPAAGLKWAYDEIRRAGGLAIFPHPYWIHDVFHVPAGLHDYMVESRYFDAFEVLGGENYYEQNGFQTVRYYEDQRRGFRYPVVGSTDSHNSNPTNRNALICSTIVFAQTDTCADILGAIRGFRSVAVDTISKEFRLVGELRLVQYACFLLRHYFPLHDELCYEEGLQMKKYVTGDAQEKAEALRVLNVIHGRVDAMRTRYFDFPQEGTAEA